MSWLRRVFGGQAGAHTTLEGVVRQPEAERDRLGADDPRIGAGHLVLHRFWAGVGTPDATLLEPDTEPELSGPMAWPGLRENYRIVRRDDGLILATDGLSDPFVGKCVENESGFGVELFLDLPGARSMTAEEVRESWAFELLTLVARNVAGFGGIIDRLDRQGTAPMAVPLTRSPGEGWLEPGGYANLLIGLPARGLALSLPMPFGPTRIVPVTLLRPEEATVAARSEDHRREIVAALIGSGYGHKTDLTRPSLV